MVIVKKANSNGTFTRMYVKRKSILNKAIKVLYRDSQKRVNTSSVGLLVCSAAYICTVAGYWLY
jgi:hypothetical protein